MLKNVLSTAVFFILSLIVFGSVQAQTNHTWESYGLSFTVPADFSEITNTDNKFEGKSDEAQINLLGLYPINAESLTEDNLQESFIDMAAAYGMAIEGGEEIKINGFTGLYTETELEDVPAFFACMLDPNGEVNFIVIIVHNNNAEKAINIMESIQAE
ncbi:hypothetical protein Fleli_1001 [Bernardetia litoralis DSM 6794]|uniref:Uncharacterized protein n=1 Tax=Bernardetia litoralis (strain ATCC 23117 / DSM 6794 / NBRC 15988 / NCIMB 1366 / Fx l1 / Sio-4) TaxID=880071 RepID=I4AHL4_BERLS|nr:hypothetical protein [Bernardetia litoralis]AFM03449.1 hypothetical protein Fleli_1001 [Bernardetia litoralis DSM 6794]